MPAASKLPLPPETSAAPKDFRKNYHANVRKDVIRLIDGPVGRVLDVGGGVGATAAFLKDAHGASYAAVVDGVAADPLPQIDSQFVGDLNDAALWDDIHQEAGLFDTILCLDVLEHLVDPWTAAARCRDLLRPGGQLIVCVPNARYHRLSFPLFFKGRFDLEPHGILDRTHLRWFVKDTAKALACPEGMTLTHVSGGWYMDRHTRLEGLARYGIAPGFLFLNYYVKSCKTP